MRRLLTILAVATMTACATTPARPMRVLVYNIHAGTDAKRVNNLERVAALIETHRPDVVLLQEVDRNTTRSGNVDQLAMLMRLTRMHGVFGKSLDFQGGEYGIAILSRWPVGAHETVPLHIDPRVALFADLQTPDGVITVANTHLDASREDTWRRQEVTELLAAMKRRPPLLIGGDFNATPDSAIIETLRTAALTDAWPLCGSGNALTYPADTPVKRIDYLFLTGPTRCTRATVLDTQASDHRPLLVDLTRP
jgi:endonuclease/exonuclease/phosphatase family metal-dependent hydrolase